MLRVMDVSDVHGDGPPCYVLWMFLMFAGDRPPCYVSGTFLDYHKIPDLSSLQSFFHAKRKTVTTTSIVIATSQWIAAP